MHKEVNIVSGNAESTVCFRICGLDQSQMKMWKAKLAGMPCEWHRRKRTDDYVCICPLEDIDLVQSLQAVLDGETLPEEHGIYVSMVTDRDNDGLRIAPFVSEFFRHVGGTIDFSFVSIFDDE